MMTEKSLAKYPINVSCIAIKCPESTQAIRFNKEEKSSSK